MKRPEDIALFDDLTVECADEDFVIITSLTGRNLASISLWTAEECTALIDALMVARDWLVHLEQDEPGPPRKDDTE